MTRTSIGEYTEAVRWRYLQASKKEKGKILDEFAKVTGYHRKAVVRLLHRESQSSINKKRGRPRAVQRSRSWGTTGGLGSN